MEGIKLTHDLRAAARLCVTAALLVLAAACSSAPSATETAAGGETGRAAVETAVTALKPAPLEAGAKLSVVATTNLVGDAVARVGGDRITLKVLLPADSDPHSYTATPQDMVALTNADVVFVNGLGLEESLLPTLGAIQGVPVVSVNEAVTPLERPEEGAGADHAHAGGDPHTWQDVRNVRQWALTIAAALGALDPAHAAAYTEAGAAYAAELDALHQEVTDALAAIPAGRRVLVTDHDTFEYFAAAYGFTVAGSVIPSFSTLATISAQEMAALQQQIRKSGAAAIFIGTTSNPRLAQQVAQDTGVPVVAIHSDSLGRPGTPESSYPGMMRSNVFRIVQALQ